MNWLRKSNGQMNGSKKSWSLEKKACLVMMVASAVVIGGGMTVEPWLDANIGKELKYQAAPKAEAAVEVVTPDKVEEMKGDVLDRLKSCENKEGVALIWDTNNQASIGDYMFQIKTVQHYWLKKNGEKVSSKEAARIALDDVKARELASWIVFEGHADDKGIGNWFNCMNRHDLDTLVGFIKSHD